MKIEFNCPACKNAHSDKPALSKYFPLLGYSGSIVIWPKQNGGIPDKVNNDYLRLITSPTVGENLIARVEFPFESEIGGTFASLYEPPLSSYNGWQCHPEEIDLSSVVLSEIESILKLESSFAWVRVVVKAVYVLGASKFNLSTSPWDSEIENHLYFFDNPEIIKHKDWIFIQASSQGDLGESLLIRKSDNCYFLNILNIWNMHSSNTYFGNIPISNDLITKYTPKNV